MVGTFDWANKQRTVQIVHTVHAAAAAAAAPCQDAARLLCFDKNFSRSPLLFGQIFFIKNVSARDRGVIVHDVKSDK